MYADTRNCHGHTASESSTAMLIPAWCCTAECTGGVVAGLLAGPLYGVGSPFLRRWLPWIKKTEVMTDSGELVDTAPRHHHPHNRHKNKRENQPHELYDTNNSEAPLYAARPISGPNEPNGVNDLHGVTTVV